MVQLLLLLPLTAPSADVDIQRVFGKAEKGQYQVKSNLLVEERGDGLVTWMPSDLDIHYKFTYAVTETKPDGIVSIRYERPTMTETEGETFDTPAKTKVDKVDLKFQVVVSPINELLDIKDLNPKKPPPPSFRAMRAMARAGGTSTEAQDVIGRFVGEIYRLSLFLGPLDSGLDFSPKLPFEEVKIGDTWKRTAGYSPQALGGRQGQSAVQRLDYTYEYKGVLEVEGKKVHRVTATLALDTDVGLFVNQLMQAKPEQTGLKAVPLHLKATIEYDLDLATRRTLRANARSEGGFSIVLTQAPDAPVHEERLRGTTRMTLVAG